MAVIAKKVSDRLLCLQSFVQDPPDSDYQRGYMAAMMDEAVDDIDEAGSDIFNDALEMYKGTPAYLNFKIRRTKTLS